MKALVRASLVATAAVLLVTCTGGKPFGPPFDEPLAIGTWGGDNAGAIVTDTIAHFHIGCTFGDVKGRISLDAAGDFSVAGSYMLHAYPVAVGPTMPAQFHGNVNGSTLTLSVSVNDTIEHKTVILGPAKMTFGKEPQMGPCPICRTPGDRASIMMSAKRSQRRH